MAVTKSAMSCRPTTAVSYFTSCFLAPPDSAQTATPATTMTAAALRMIFFLFIFGMLKDYIMSWFAEQAACLPAVSVILSGA